MVPITRGERLRTNERGKSIGWERGITAERRSLLRNTGGWPSHRHVGGRGQSGRWLQKEFGAKDSQQNKTAWSKGLLLAGVVRDFSVVGGGKRPVNGS